MEILLVLVFVLLALMSRDFHTRLRSIEAKLDALGQRPDRKGGD